MKLRAPVVKKSIYSKKQNKTKTDMKTHPTDKIRQQLIAMPFFGDRSVICNRRLQLRYAEAACLFLDITRPARAMHGEQGLDRMT